MTDGTVRVRAIAIAVVGIGIFALVATLVAGLAVGTNGESLPSATVLAEREVAIRISDFEFEPKSVSVPQGAAVTWRNEDDARHSATDRRGRWDTGTFDQNESATVTFDNPGAYEYICTVHPEMRGTLVVRAD